MDMDMTYDEWLDSYTDWEALRAPAPVRPEHEVEDLRALVAANEAENDVIEAARRD